MRWYVDVSNVVGSVPDGWWRDRRAAEERLLDALERFAERTGDEVWAVCDAGTHPRRPLVAVVVAPRPGPDAADHVIERLVAADPAPSRAAVVTSDRRLAAVCRARGATTAGARAFRRRIDLPPATRHSDAPGRSSPDGPRST